MRYEEIVDKSVALLMLSQDFDGKDDWAVVRGMVSRSGADLMFVAEGGSGRFPLPEDALDRMKPTNPDMQDILLGADICLMLSVGPKPEEAGGSDFISTGLTWPQEQE